VLIDINERIAFLRKALGKCAVGNDGVNISFYCPVCNNDKMKLVVKVDDGRWHCWVCGTKGGSVVSLLRKFSQASLPEWKKRFEAVEERTFIDEPVEKKEEVKVPDGFIMLAEYWGSDPDANAVLNYLRSRDVTESDMWRFRLGTSLTGRNRRRVIIPSFDSSGKINFWTSRTVDKDTQPRYLNPKADRREIVFNELDIDWNQELMVCEGPFDVIRADGNTTCLLGSTLTKNHALFAKITSNRTPVILALDDDAESKQHKIAKLLYEHDISVRILDTGDAKDVGEMNREEIRQARKDARPWSLNNRLQFLISTISSGSMF